MCKPRFLASRRGNLEVCLTLRTSWWDQVEVTLCGTLCASFPFLVLLPHSLSDLSWDHFLYKPHAPKFYPLIYFWEPLPKSVVNTIAKEQTQILIPSSLRATPCCVLVTWTMHQAPPCPSQGTAASTLVPSSQH